MCTDSRFRNEIVAYKVIYLLTVLQLHSDKMNKIYFKLAYLCFVIIEAKLSLVRYKNQTFCVIGNNSRAISWISKQGKDMFHPPSTFYHAISLKSYYNNLIIDDSRNRNSQDWHEVSSIENFTLFDLYPVTDFRMENFTDNTMCLEEDIHNQTSLMDYLVRKKWPVGAKISFSIFSISQEEMKIEICDSLSKCFPLPVDYLEETGKYNLEAENLRWIHFRIEVTMDQILVVQLKSAHIGWKHFTLEHSLAIFTDFSIKFTFENADILKLHDYKFLWSNVEGSTTILNEIKVNSNLPCISLFCAKCEACEMVFQLTYGNQTSDFLCRSEKHFWNRKQFCNDAPFEKLTLKVIKLTKQRNQNQFWAIDRIYLSDASEARFLNSNLILDGEGCNYVDMDKTEPVVQIDRKLHGSYSKLCGNDVEALLTENQNFTICCAVNNISQCFIHNNQKIKENVFLIFPNFLMLSVAVLVFLIIVAIIALYLNRRKMKTSMDLEPLIELQTIDNSNQNQNVKITNKEIKSFTKDNIIQYMKQIFRGKSDLEKQFRSVEEADYTCDVALYPQNSYKNRYQEFVPFDKTRVTLKNPGFGTDYINASFVEGPHGPRSYIATQNPTDNTVDDFWLMVWQQNVKTIISLSNTLLRSSNDRPYWPDAEKKEMVFGMITVKFRSVIIRNYFNILYLLINCQKELREVKLLQFIVWHHRNPIPPCIFMPFLKEIPTSKDEVPILVHCHAGIGRTGTLILFHFAATLLLNGNKVSMVTLLRKIKCCRRGMVQNLNQYMLTHLLLLEYFTFNSFLTTSSPSFFEDLQIQLSNADQILTHLNELQQLSEKVYPTALHNNNTDKNRFPHILPSENCRVILENKHQYINAMVISGYRVSKKYVTTQHPLPVTTLDFWVMVKEYNVSIIVNLNEVKDDELFWTCSKVQEIRVESYSYFDCIVLEVTLDMAQKSTEKEVRLYNVRNWFNYKQIPESKEDILEMALNIRELANDQKLVVMCENGIKACGLFVAILKCLDQLERDRYCDIPQVVRELRCCHPQFMEFSDQLEFLYTCADAYFKSKSNDYL